MATSKAERVTNESSSGYCKMPDGTLIQWGEKTYTSGATAQYGSLYQMPAAIPLPIAFYDTNYRLFGSSRFGTGAEMAIGQQVSSCTTTSAGARVIDVAGRTLSSSMKLTIWWTAIGRWKA